MIKKIQSSWLAGREQRSLAVTAGWLEQKSAGKSQGRAAAHKERQAAHGGHTCIAHHQEDLRKRNDIFGAQRPHVIVSPSG